MAYNVKYIDRDGCEGERTYYDQSSPEQVLHLLRIAKSDVAPIRIVELREVAE